LETPLSIWIQRLELSDEAFTSREGVLVELLTGTKPSPKPDIENFLSRIGDISVYMNMKSSPVFNESIYKKYSTALNWYLEALTSENINTRLVNLCIVIEILLGSDNRHAWKKIELPERVALLVGKNGRERESLKSTTDGATKRRNSIVHQGETIIQDDKELIDNFHAIVFRVLQSELEVLKNTARVSTTRP